MPVYIKVHKHKAYNISCLYKGPQTQAFNISCLYKGPQTQSF